MMKVTLAVLALAASASAFTAPAAERTTTALGMDRRGAFAQIGVVAAGLASVPAMASADGSVSASTISRARGIYGDRIANLKPAVADGNFAAVVDEKAAFVLFNSGAYPKNKGMIMSSLRAAYNNSQGRVKKDSSLLVAMWYIKDRRN